MTLDKRIVLRTTMGANAGRREIQGTVSQLFADIGMDSLPPRVDGVPFGDHTGSARLMYEKNSYVLYVECEPVVDAEDDGA